ncbi:MAG: 16S rRNA (uracil(1498)-N(3))-methyltransferase [Muribaculaceae bacterium]|nr:16S rRNA (uracil(1498)-N(3))-methyltransferase [Muribaculaceae bacterium]
MIQFFAPDIATNPLLPESESQHCVKVLRKGLGDVIPVIDGKGKRYICRIIDPHPKRTLLEIIEVSDEPQPWPATLTLAVAPTKHIDRMEWLVEKLVEIGINRFTPLLCSRSERKETKRERIEKIAVSAMKQSLKAALPVVDEMTPLKRFIKESSALSCDKFVAYCDTECQRKILAKEISPAKDTVILIGPEGDFSPQEIEDIISSGFIPVTLGDCRLRTETAALAAAQTFHVINQLYQQ